MIPAREDGLGENLRRGSSMDKGQEPGVSVACAPEGEGTCLRGAYDSPVPPTRYSALPFGFGQIAKLMQSQFTKTILAVSKEISIPSSARHIAPLSFLLVLQEMLSLSQCRLLSPCQTTPPCQGHPQVTRVQRQLLALNL